MTPSSRILPVLVGAAAAAGVIAAIWVFARITGG